MFKVLWLLNLDGSYPREITDLTYPFIYEYADKIDAEVRIISERKFADKGWPSMIEKFQIGNSIADWNIYLDSDALINPDCMDFTELIYKDTVLFNGTDFANLRFKYNKYHRRDKRNIGACGWFCISSDWVAEDLYDLSKVTPEFARASVKPSLLETQYGSQPDHFVEEFVLSHNIARFGLEVDKVPNLLHNIGFRGPVYLWHTYNVSVDTKVQKIREILNAWYNGMFLEMETKEHTNAEV